MSERVERVCLHAGHSNKMKKETQRIPFVFFYHSLRPVRSASPLFSRFMYDTSNNILKLSIQLLHIYGNLVKAWFTISLLFFFLPFDPFRSLDLFIQQTWPCRLMLVAFWIVAKPIDQTTEIIAVFQASLGFLMFDNFASKIDGLKKTHIHIIRLTKWRHFCECW